MTPEEAKKLVSQARSLYERCAEICMRAIDEDPENAEIYVARLNSYQPIASSAQEPFLSDEHAQTAH